MTDVTADDWDSLENLAERVGCPRDKVGALRRRLTSTDVRKGGPYILLIGRPEGRLDLFLSRWLNPDLAEEVKKSTGRPVAVGPAPSTAQPKVGSWAEQKLTLPIPGHIVALRSDGKPSAEVLAQAASLGHFDACVLVVSLHQVLSEGERALLQAACPLSIVGRVLVIAVPGEEPTADDIAQLNALGRRCLMNAGFQAERAGQVGVWFTDNSKRSGTITDVASFVAADPTITAVGRNGWARESLVKLVTELSDFAKKSAPPPSATVEEKDQDRLTKELDGFLTDLGKRIERDVTKRAWTNEKVRQEVIESVQGWSAYLGMEGAWMRLVDRLRPGAQKALHAEAQAAADAIEYDSGKATQVVKNTAPPDATNVLAIRIAIAVAAGIGAFAVTSWALTQIGGASASPAVHTTFSIAGPAVGALLGFLFSGKVFTPLPASAAGSAAPEASEPEIHGWTQFQRRMTTWFRKYIGSRPASPSEECDAWLERLGATVESRS